MSRAKRYGPPKIRKRTRHGRGCWIYDLSCGCGWAAVVGGAYTAAARTGRAHWGGHWGAWAA